MDCLDFQGKPLHQGDWVIRPERCACIINLVYSRLEEDPQKTNDENGWAFWIVTYSSFLKKFGRRGKAERHQSMIRIDESEVPKEIVAAYGK